MIKLPIDVSELEMIFDSSFPEARYYLDLRTGDTIMIMDEARRYLDENYDELHDLTQEKAADFEELVRDHPMPAWMRDVVCEARQVELGYGDRFVDIPAADSRAAYQDMEDFVETVGSDRLAQLLAFALDGPRPFRRFKDALAGYPDERQHWFGFKSGRLRQRVLDWLASLDIEPEDATQ